MSRGRSNARRGVCADCGQIVTILFRTGLYAEHDIGDEQMCPGGGKPSGIAPASAREKPAPKPRKSRTNLREIALRHITELAWRHLGTLQAIRFHHAERRDPDAVPSDTRTCHRPMTKEEREQLLGLETARAHAERDLQEALDDYRKRFP